MHANIGILVPRQQYVNADGASINRTINQLTIDRSNVKQWGKIFVWNESLVPSPRN